jgi:hypothetical protein
MRESGQEVRARFSSSAMNFRSSKDSSRRATVSFLQVRQRAAIPQRGCPDTWTSTTTVEFNALSSCNYCGGMAGGSTARSERRTERAGMVCPKRGLCQWKCSWIVSSRISLSGMGKTGTGEKISAETGWGAERPLSKVVVLG